LFTDSKCKPEEKELIQLIKQNRSVTLQLQDLVQINSCCSPSLNSVRQGTTGLLIQKIYLYNIAYSHTGDFTSMDDNDNVQFC
jgi:hypothetical protein